MSAPAPHSPSGSRARAGTRPAAAWLVLALVAAAHVLALHAIQPPSVAPADASPEVFSAERAARRLDELCRLPHAVGSEEHARVLAALVAQLEGLGLDPHVREGSVAGIELRNVVARIAGAGVGGADADSTEADSAEADSAGADRAEAHSTGADGPAADGAGAHGAGRSAILLMAHYDSVPSGPGAADDGAGVVTLLETARAALAGPPLRHDLILLFTDGEEAGLLGARLFVASDPWRGDAFVVLNFEARGNAGPSILFETGVPAGALIEHLARIPAAFGSSAGPAIYERMPNDTDFTLFKRDVPGLNFAFIGGVSAYHRPWDTIENLDLRSVQHHGEHALGLVRALGEVDPDAVPSPERSFFPLAGWGLVQYPRGTSVTVGIVALAVAAGALLVGLRRGAFGGGVFGGGAWVRAVVSAPVLVAAVAFVALLAWWLCGAIPARAVAALTDAAPRGNHGSGLLVVTGAWTATLAALLGWLRRGHVARAGRGGAATGVTAGTGAHDGATGAWAAAGVLWWGLVVAAVLNEAPGASDALTWWLLAAVVGAAIPARASRAALAGLVLLLGLAAWLPTLHLVGMVLALSPRTVVVVTAVLTALTLLPWTPLLAQLARSRAAVWTTAAAAALLYTGAGVLSALGR